MERPWKQTIERRGVCGSALKLRAVWEGDRREAKVRTGLGKSHRPGSQGGIRKRGLWRRLNGHGKRKRRNSQAFAYGCTRRISIPTNLMLPARSPKFNLREGALQCQMLMTD